MELELANLDYLLANIELSKIIISGTLGATVGSILGGINGILNRKGYEKISDPDMKGLLNVINFAIPIYWSINLTRYPFNDNVTQNTIEAVSYAIILRGSYELGYQGFQKLFYSFKK